MDLGSSHTAATVRRGGQALLSCSDSIYAHYVQRGLVSDLQWVHSKGYQMIA